MFRKMLLAVGATTRYYSPPPWGVISVSNQQLTPIPSRCRVESNRERDARRATGRKVVLVVFSGTLLS